MADPILTLAATIAGFAMAVIGWYRMLCAGMDRVYQDVQSAKNLEKDASDLQIELRRHEKEVKL